MKPLYMWRRHKNYTEFKEAQEQKSCLSKVTHLLCKLHSDEDYEKNEDYTGVDSPKSSTPQSSRRYSPAVSLHASLDLSTRNMSEDLVKNAAETKLLGDAAL